MRCEKSHGKFASAVGGRFSVCGNVNLLLREEMSVAVGAILCCLDVSRPFMVIYE